VSPTVFIVKKLKFYFNSREEERIHVHITAPEGEAKFWLEPIVALDKYYGFKKSQLNKIQTIIEERKNEITKKWKKHFINRSS
jgi:hypothetical protein